MNKLSFICESKHLHSKIYIYSQHLLLYKHIKLLPSQIGLQYFNIFLKKKWSKNMRFLNFNKLFLSLVILTLFVSLSCASAAPSDIHIGSI